jgi:hypothetical protein
MKGLLEKTMKAAPIVLKRGITLWRPHCEGQFRVNSVLESQRYRLQRKGLRKICVCVCVCVGVLF